MEEISFSIEMIDVKLLTGLVHIFELVVACHPMVGAMCNSLSYDSKDFRTSNSNPVFLSKQNKWLLAGEVWMTSS